MHGETIEGYSLLVLAIGPALYQLSRAIGTMLASLNGLVYVGYGRWVVRHFTLQQKGLSEEPPSTPDHAHND